MKKKYNIKRYIPVVIAAIIFVCAYFLSSSIYEASFEQYIYSLLKSTGNSVSGFSYVFILGFFCTLVLSFIFIVPIYENRNVTIKGKNIFPIKNYKRYSRVIVILSIIYLGSCVGFFDYVGNRLRDTDLYKEHYVNPNDVDIKFPLNKQNLIYIYLESTETTNVSRDNGGIFEKSIMPHLEDLALNNINFSNSNKLGGAVSSYGTGWTVAAMIAQTSGIPLKMKIDDYENNSTSFSNITTLGDILGDAGYNSYLFMGSDANFGGRKAYFSNHNYIVSDYNTAKEEGKIDSDYHVWWGYEDSKLFSYAKSKLSEISKDDKPFNLTLLTANTHFTDGYLEEDCDKVFDNDYANSFYCSDNLINEFIDWVKEQDFYDNTTIIITGDHLTMQENFYNIDDNYTRTVYNAFINSRIVPSNEKNRVFTTMDMFPTTLASLGASIEGDRLGLGTNLFSDKRTLAEEYGIQKLNKELKKNSNYYYKYLRG